LTETVLTLKAPLIKSLDNTLIMNISQLFSQTPLDTLFECFTWLRAEQKPTYKNTIATLASNRRLRPVFITKKPLQDQFKWIAAQLSRKENNMVGEHLLQVWFMEGKQDLLVDFCDHLNIAHDGSGTVESELPESFDSELLQKAIDQLLDKYTHSLVSLYLHIFNMQKQDGWPELTDRLNSDARLELKGQ